MTGRLTAALALLVCVPLLGTLWLANRVALDDAARVEADLRAAARGRLEDTRASLARLLADRARTLRAQATEWPEGSENAREALRRTWIAPRALVLDDRGRVEFPPMASRSADEAATVERLRPLWQGGSLGRARPVDANVGGGATASPEPDEGYVPWYFAEGLQLVFWKRRSDGRVVCFELDRARLLADLVGALPDAGSAGPRAALRDERGAALYLWGGDEVPGPAEFVALEAPLEGWRLEQGVAPSVQGATGLAPWLGAAALGVALVALAVVVRRESTRALREAAQRVTFVNHVSHELKTPLTNIRMYAEMLEETLDPDEQPEAARHLGVVVAESQRLSRLIANILTFARQSRGHLEVRPRSTVPDEVVREALRGFEPVLRARGVEVETDLRAGQSVALDADAFGQVLANLVGNVEKYAASGRWVRVATRQAGEVLTLTVSDRGPGVPRGAEERIFAPFERLSDRLSEGASGTGIGLTIVRELARLHGGDARLVPEQGQGATFEVTFQTIGAQRSP
jgi:signal transduction histidine kinase